MNTVPAIPACRDLREVNKRLTAFFTMVETQGPERAAHWFTPEAQADLNALLEQGAGWLKAGTAAAPPEWQQEYQGHLRALHQLLPQVQQRLEEFKATLVQQQERLRGMKSLAKAYARYG